MKAKGRKAKGSKNERWIAEQYIKYELDKTAGRMPLSGAVEHMKGDIRKAADGWLDECKNQERIQLWKWWDQTKMQCGKGEKPVLHFTSNNKDSVTMVKTEDWFDMRKALKEFEETVERYDRGEVNNILPKTPQSIIWAVKDLKRACTKVVKELSSSDE